MKRANPSFPKTMKSPPPSARPKVSMSSTKGSPHEILPGKGRGAAREASGGGVSPPVVTPLRQHCVLPPPLAGEDWVMLQGVGNSGAHAKALRSEEHTSELQSLMRISYAVLCLKKKIRLLTHTK